MCACASARSAESGARRTDAEPLPDDHPLWGAPGVLSITPQGGDLADRSPVAPVGAPNRDARLQVAGCRAEKVSDAGSECDRDHDNNESDHGDQNPVFGHRLTALAFKLRNNVEDRLHNPVSIGVLPRKLEPQ